jgi:hypothetical protein
MVSEAGQFGGALDEGDVHPSVMITPTAIQNLTRMSRFAPNRLRGCRLIRQPGHFRRQLR